MSTVSSIGGGSPTAHRLSRRSCCLSKVSAARPKYDDLVNTQSSPTLLFPRPLLAARNSPGSSVLPRQLLPWHMQWPRYTRPPCGLRSRRRLLSSSGDSSSSRTRDTRGQPQFPTCVSQTRARTVSTAASKVRHGGDLQHHAAPDPKKSLGPKCHAHHVSSPSPLQNHQRARRMGIEMSAHTRQIARRSTSKGTGREWERHK